MAYTFRLQDSSLESKINRTNKLRLYLYTKIKPTGSSKVPKKAHERVSQVSFWSSRSWQINNVEHKIQEVMFFNDTWTLYFMYTEGNLNIHVISQIWMCQFWFCWKNKDILWHLTLFTANHWWFSLKVVKQIFLYQVPLFLESHGFFFCLMKLKVKYLILFPISRPHR